jgi:hypothetical protein
MTGKESNDFIFKMESTYPGIEPDNLFDLISNIDNRVKWDERWVGGKVIA